jgi:hypothetical protein
MIAVDNDTIKTWIQFETANTYKHAHSQGKNSNGTSLMDEEDSDSMDMKKDRLEDLMEKLKGVAGNLETLSHRLESVHEKQSEGKTYFFVSISLQNLICSY